MPKDPAICGISRTHFAPVPHALSEACTLDLSSEKTILDARSLKGRLRFLLFAAKGLF